MFMLYGRYPTERQYSWLYLNDYLQGKYVNVQAYKEYWVNVYGHGRDKAYGYMHDSIKNADKGNSWAKGEAIAAYRIHVKIKEVKPLMKIFGVEIPGVHYGDGYINR